MPTKSARSTVSFKNSCKQQNDIHFSDTFIFDKHRPAINIINANCVLPWQLQMEFLYHKIGHHRHLMSGRRLLETTFLQVGWSYTQILRLRISKMPHIRHCKNILNLRGMPNSINWIIKPKPDTNITLISKILQARVFVE